jgi:hypothetical protein
MLPPAPPWTTAPQVSRYKNHNRLRGSSLWKRRTSVRLAPHEALDNALDGQIVRASLNLRVVPGLHPAISHDTAQKHGTQSGGSAPPRAGQSGVRLPSLPGLPSLAGSKRQPDSAIRREDLEDVMTISLLSSVHATKVAMSMTACVALRAWLLRIGSWSRSIPYTGTKKSVKYAPRVGSVGSFSSGTAVGLCLKT